MQRCRVLPLVQKSALRTIERDLVAISRDLASPGGGASSLRSLSGAARSVDEIEQDSQRAAVQVASLVGGGVEVGVCGRQLGLKSQRAVAAWLRAGEMSADATLDTW